MHWYGTPSGPGAESALPLRRACLSSSGRMAGGGPVCGGCQLAIALRAVCSNDDGGPRSAGNIELAKSWSFSFGLSIQRPLWERGGGFREGLGVLEILLNASHMSLPLSDEENSRKACALAFLAACWNSALAVLYSAKACGVFVL